jgi:hypothetical protein
VALNVRRVAFFWDSNRAQRQLCAILRGVGHWVSLSRAWLKIAGSIGFTALAVTVQVGTGQIVDKPCSHTENGVSGPV